MKAVVEIKRVDALYSVQVVGRFLRNTLLWAVFAQSRMKRESWMLRLSSLRSQSYRDAGD